MGEIILNLGLGLGLAFNPQHCSPLSGLYVVIMFLDQNQAEIT